MFQKFDHTKRSLLKTATKKCYILSLLSTFSSVVVWMIGEIASKSIHFEQKESVRTGEYKTETLEWA